MTAAPTDYRAQQAERGYLVLYRQAETNHCPGCGHSQWHVGRTVAECAHCATAVPLMAPISPASIEGE